MFFSSGEVGIFENFHVHHWLGNFKKEEPRARTRDNQDKIVRGKWIGKKEREGERERDRERERETERETERDRERERERER